MKWKTEVDFESSSMTPRGGERRRRKREEVRLNQRNGMVRWLLSIESLQETLRL